MVLSYKLRTEEVPRMFGISYEFGDPETKKPPALILLVRKDILPLLINPKLLAPVEEIRRRGKFEIFSTSFDEVGFNSAFIRKGTEGKFLKFGAPVHCLKVATSEVCPDCGGTKKDRIYKGKCFACEGKGKRIISNWQPLNAITATLSVFMTLSEILPIDGADSDLPPQLFTFGITNQATGGFENRLWGYYGIEFSEWLASKPNTRFSEAERAMEEICYHIHGRVLGDGFRVNTQDNFGNNPWLSISCMEGDCGIEPVDYNLKNLKTGQRFSAINIGNTSQLLMLLAALAALHDQYDREAKIF